MTKPLIDNFPELYKKILPDQFHENIPFESIATCSDCIMCKNYEQKKRNKQKYFLPTSKCCTYQPNLPNYLIGGILSDNSEMMMEGKNRIKEKIKNKIGITPLYVLPSIGYKRKYEVFAKYNFGRNKKLLCPYYESNGGLCTIWKYREATCSTWFCESVGEEQGKNFWGSTKNNMKLIEKKLSKYVLLKLGLEHLLDHTYEELRTDNLVGKINLIKYKNIWKEWVGKEVEYYQNAYRIIKDLDSHVFENIMGSSSLDLMEDMRTKKKIFEEKVHTVKN